jgi:hypothetical protein
MPMLLLDRPAKASATGVPPPHAQKCIFSSAGASTRLWGAPAACARGSIGGRASVGQAIRLARQGFLSVATPSLGAAERNDPLGVNPYPIVQPRSWSLRCCTLGRPEDIDTEGVGRSCDPGLLLEAPSAWAR